jgi:GNAT superfamily N-acetyltransferase
MYRATFGTAGSEEAAWLLTELFQAGVLSLEASRVCERGERVIGVALLSVGEPLARGSARAYWRLLRRQLGLPRAPRAFFGGLAVLFFTERRIPKAEELVYIKALAVVETERGRGVGTCLLQDTARWTLEQGRAWLGLHVLDSNVRARRLYERMGFHPWRAASSRSLAARLLARYRPDWSGSLMIRAVQEAMQGGPSATLG